MQKTLLISPAWIGDSVMAEPLIAELDRQGIVDVLAPAWVAPVFSFMSNVRDVVAAPFTHGRLGLRARFGVGRQLAERAYDRAVVLPNSWKASLTPMFAGIPQRTGYLGEMRWGLLNDVRSSKNAPALQSMRNLALALTPNAPIPPVIAPRLSVTKSQVAAAWHSLELPESVRPIVLCPGAEYGPTKRWPLEYFADIAKRGADCGHPVWVMGGSKEKSAGETLAKESGALNLCSTTSLAQAICLLSQARVVLANDSGLMHVAAALGRPTIALFGSSDPKITPAQGPQVHMFYLGLPCSPCFARECPLGHLKCLKDLHPQLVWATLSKFLQN